MVALCRAGFRDSMYCSTISASISSGRDTVASARYRTCLSLSHLRFSLAFNGSTFQLKRNSTPGECSLFLFPPFFFFRYFVTVTDAYGFFLWSTFLFACAGNQYCPLPWIDRTQMSRFVCKCFFFLLEISISFRISLFSPHSHGSFSPAGSCVLF